jgi:hypothetical protein
VIKLLDKIVPEAVRENFSTIEAEINSLPLAKGDWQHLEITVSGAVANFKYPHSLGFIPKEKIETSVTEGVDVTWHFSRFTRTHVEITTNGACTVRAFVGSYFKR